MDIKQIMTQQHLAIIANLQELTAAVGAYSTKFESSVSVDDPVAMGELAQSHVDMLGSVKQMQSAVYGPINMVTLHFEEFFRSAAFRSLLEMGVVDALPVDGSGMSATDLAEKLKVDEELLVRLLRIVVPTFFTESSIEVYAHTPNSLVYLFPPLRGGFIMMYDEYGPSSVKLSEFLKKNGYQNPNSLTNNPYTYAHDTKGLNMFEFLAKDPIRFKNFNDAMQAKNMQSSWPYNLFPFKEELSKVETTDETVLLIDIGGGNGQAVTAIRELCHSIKGRMILQDQAQVIEEITDPLPNVEKMPHDFFATQPVQGALIYYIRRCLHDWPENECVAILKNIAAAMKPRTSRLLISEIVMPQGEIDNETSWYDICMLMFSGMERSEKQWKALLHKSGLTLLQIHGAIGGSNHRVLEAVLKQSTCII
ncbi:o-methyltransferase-like protein [Mollisia scopiformis]|uniref:O-methyltransferas-like protein n=1 Tax=Mollisia scopiformis TaxID=149040 RepID=A0A194XL53_MOLSC|nr:o-methyltransferase-like protein [Mollisia scopiformis]KUJ20824.1 o-methyltransferas-like protein [Mollisia scopiformis]